MGLRWAIFFVGRDDRQRRLVIRDCQHGGQMVGVSGDP